MVTAQITQAVEQIDAAASRQEVAFDTALGVYCDNPDEPAVVALVWRGKLAQLHIADPVCKLPGKQPECLINAVIINAFAAWQDDYTQKLTNNG